MPGNGKLLTYQRYNVELSRDGLRALGAAVTDAQIADIQEMDAPGNIPMLEAAGTAIGHTMTDAHFPGAFDLTEKGVRS